jgi:hypothetical protein
MARARPRSALALLAATAATLVASCGGGSDESTGFTAPAPKPAGPPKTVRVSAAGSTRALERALRAAGPGDTIVLDPGAYGRRGEVLRIRTSGTPGRPVTIRSRARGGRARLLGQVRVEGDRVRLLRLLFDGPTGQVEQPSADNPGGEDVQLWIRGAHATLADSEVRGNLWHAGIFVTADGARILRNRVHDNGDPSDPARSTLDQGIYWSSGSDGLIAGNLVQRNVAFGIQLYPDAKDVRVVANTLVHNGRAGLVIGGDTSGVTAIRNIIAFNGDPRVTVNLSGEGNRLAGNLFWANGTPSALAATNGLSTARNSTADPAGSAPELGAAGLDSNIR